MNRYITRGAYFFLGIGMVWLYAWILNPALTSGTVWFVGAIVGLILQDLGEVNDILVDDRERRRR